jgi:7-cyano-7-deazaguanine reductase
MTTIPRYTDEHARAGPATLKISENQFRGYEVVIDNPECTSVFPKTGLPDAGVITLSYPRERCLRLKSFKEYLFCCRNLGTIQENVVNQLLEDVGNACHPDWADVRGDFRPRRGLSTVVTACWPRPANTR